MALGVGTVAAHGAGAGVWLRNPIAWAVGLMVAMGLALHADRRWMVTVLLTAPACLAATLFDTGQAGVHRWLTIGPVSVNVAQLVLPPMVVALASRRLDSAGLAAATLSLVVLSLQPDASQALSLGAALLTIALVQTHSVSVRLSSIVIAAIAVVATALQGDPLDPVAEVEGVIGLASAITPLLAGAM
ncbi:MAG: hypothetical protein U1C74_25455, partial [Phenylobacterium sp.]|nr:hypothetical protein [Phenylobacterium sp.]